VKVGGVVLAAGRGSRFGRPKAEVEVGGHRLVDLAVEACVGAGLDPVVVVIGAARVEIPSVAHGDMLTSRVRVVDNPAWATGMASSLRAGLAALAEEDLDAAVVTLVDTPTVVAAHLRRVVGQLALGSSAAVAAYQGQARTPVGLARDVWSDVARSVTGDEGARGWLRRNSQRVATVECGDLGPWQDIDTPADLPV
jgi:CTP:molybdopterin cytidylyltransferase MocA